MEYDKTIKYGVEPFNIMNTQKAYLFHPFEEGYFANHLSDYADIAGNLSKGNIVMGRLIGISEKSGLYKCDCETASGIQDFEYFLPVQFVHEVENWRPFTPSEFMAMFRPGQEIHVKNVTNGRSFTARYKGCFFYGDLHVALGTMCLSLEELFKTYEILEHNHYVPFGVKESEQKKTD